VEPYPRRLIRPASRATRSGTVVRSRYSASLWSLSCEVDAPSAYDSLVLAMAVVETVVAGVLAARGDEARARMAACEQVARAADLLD